MASFCTFAPTELGSFFTSHFKPHPSDFSPIGFVLHIHHPCNVASPRCPILPKFGFVSHNRPAQGGDAGPRGSRSAAGLSPIEIRNSKELASFCTSHFKPHASNSFELALFCRGSLPNQVTITPFPQDTCPSSAPAENWVCLAQLSLWKPAHCAHFWAPPAIWLCLYIALRAAH